jgi:ribosomal protein S12
VELVAPKRRNLKNAVPLVKAAAKRKNVIPRKSSVTAKKPKSQNAVQLTNTNLILLFATAQIVTWTLGCFFVSIKTQIRSSCV